MKKFITINSVIFFLFLLLAFNCIVSHAQEKIVKLNFQALQSITFWNVPLQKEWINEIDKGTDGTVKITHYAGGLLSPMGQTYDSVVRGIVDMGETVLAYSQGRFPFMEIGDTPIGWTTAYASGKLINELYKKYKPKEFDDIKVLFFHTNTPYRLHANKPIYKLEDLKGLKVRTSGGTAPVVRLLGATPVAMTQGETYDALSKGVVDADWNSDATFWTWKLADVSKYSIWCDTTGNVAVWIVAMNKGKWNSLTPKQQKVIEEASLRLMEKQLRGWDAQEKQIIEWAKKERGIKFIVLPEAEQRRWGDKVKPMADNYVQKMKKLGFPGEEVIKFAVDYLKTHQ